MNHVKSAPVLHRRLLAGVTLAAMVAAQVAITPAAQAALPQLAPGINFAAKLPLVHEDLPLYRLSSTGAPTGLVQSVLSLTKTTPLTMVKSLYVSRNGRGALKAYVDPVRGDAEVFPDFTAAGAGRAEVSHATLQMTATSVFNRADMIPKDATTVRLGTETPVMAATQSRSDATHAAPQKLFTYINVGRYAHGLPVFGKGSKASVAIAGDGSIRGLVRHWQAANIAGSVTPTTTEAQLIASINAQLHQFENAHTQITVNKISSAYYDGGAKYIQPVYAFLATIRGGKVSDDHVVGFVPVGKLAEAIPTIGATSGPAPTSANNPLARARTENNGSFITLGEYANDDGTMLDMANAYKNGYADNSPWWAPAIIRTEWYWAYPGDYVGASANWLANSVNIAYTQPHGDWWENTTNGNGVGFFYINDIGTNGNPGFGAAAGGILSTWILDSCEVIPSMYDLQVTTGNPYNAFTPWWPVFQGLHRALGYRTEMLLGMDDMNYNIAYAQAGGADAISAYFNGISAVDFNGMFGTYYDYHLGFNVNYDRASVMLDSRNGGESIYATQGQSAASGLTNIWMGN